MRVRVTRCWGSDRRLREVARPQLHKNEMFGALRLGVNVDADNVFPEVILGRLTTRPKNKEVICGLDDPRQVPAGVMLSAKKVEIYLDIPWNLDRDAL